MDDEAALRSACHHRAAPSSIALRVAQLERANHDLEAFAHQLAHELRTPIGQVAKIAGLLLDRPCTQADPDLRRWLELQLVTARHMSQAVQDLLDLGRSAVEPLRREELDFTALCENVRGQLCDAPRRAPVDWRIQRGMQIRGDAGQIQLVMRNLLSNAAKYTRDVEAPQISVRARASGRGATVMVEDNGAGFSGTDAQRLFQPFVRLHGHRFPGTGLGLTIVKRVVERHGGIVQARGRPGEGARFAFTLAG